jgi:hypothetical protein
MRGASSSVFASFASFAVVSRARAALERACSLRNPNCVKSSRAMSSRAILHSKYALDSVAHAVASRSRRAKHSKYRVLLASHSWKWSSGNTPRSGA